MFTIAPDFCSRIRAAASRVPFQVPLRWTWITRSKSSSDMVRIVASRVIPALLTKTSSEPNVVTAVSISAATSSAETTSQRTPTATSSPPSSFAAARAAASSRSPSTTRAPWAT
jgi:recombination DNA repair RAD52 pathway protein